MRFTFVTLFPSLIECYFCDSILKRAIDNQIIKIDFINPRDFTQNKHKKVDDYQVGGGAGLTMVAQPLFDSLDFVLKQNKKAHIIFLTPSGKKFNQQDAKTLSTKKHIVFVSGRYEGIDERVIEKYANEVYSIGDYVLTGGELPSLVMCDAISRNIKNVLGNTHSLKEESFNDGYLEAPTFTKPSNFRNLLVPSEFLKGNHSKIALLKSKMSKHKTKYYRPDIYKGIENEK